MLTEPPPSRSSRNAARSLSVALTQDINLGLAEHLDRPDGQEDLTFALYRWSRGKHRDTALIVEAVLPEGQERSVHGNASFTGAYVLRAARIAVERDCGLALLHTHPGATTWQGLSPEDQDAEAGLAIQAEILTGEPLLGLTYGSGNGTYSARLWPTPLPGRLPEPSWARSVRSVGTNITVSHNPAFTRTGSTNRRAVRTMHAWGPAAHENLTRLRVGVIGAGSVAQPVAEALARTGFTDITVMDFDAIEEHNLDRLLHGTISDIGRAKVAVLAAALARNAVADPFTVTPLEHSVVEDEGWLAALDCDVLFSCVDRPWPRFALNVAAYAHLIPVVDGGVAVDIRNADGRKPFLRGAEWRAHLVGPGRKCLECLGQYDPADVTLERTGLLDDERYISSLPAGHRLRTRENVFVFSMACAAAELLELFRAVIRPGGISDVGATLSHWTTAQIERDTDSCAPTCPFHEQLLAAGDSAPVQVTGPHPAAEDARASRGTDLDHRHPLSWWSRTLRLLSRLRATHE